MAIGKEAVLQALARGRSPLWHPKSLLRELRAAPQSRRQLLALLRELAAEGRVERVGGRYRLRRSDGLVEGTYLETEGVLVVEDGGGAHPAKASGGARPGDRVLALPSAAGAQAEILQVLEGSRPQWIGIVARSSHRSGGGVVTPYRDDREWGIRVPAAALGRARDGDVVVVEPLRSRRQPGEVTGRVVEVLGPPGTPEADFRAVVWRRRLPVEFPPGAQAEAEQLEGRLDPAELGRRVDLRALPFVTIDPATARDHDDAVCVEARAGGGWRLWVAIADVAHYVRGGSALDAEALRRGNSVYFPDRAIPMLPERLSADLCSLVPCQDRLAVAVELELDRSGHVRRRSFYPAVMRSRAQLTYEQAAAAMEGAGDALGPGLVARLCTFARLARRLRERRFAAGSIDFDLPTAEIVLGDEGHPVDIVEAPRTIAHRAVEEAMLAANRAVAEALAAAQRPALYRVHDPPLPQDMEALCEFLAAFGLLATRPRRELEPRDVARAIQRVAGRPEERLVNLVTLRSMRQARYAGECRAHFGLAFERYTHFTSPIRRYADLVVHRALQHMLVPPAVPQAAGDALERIAARLSWCERRAMEAEREMVDLKKCAFMRRHLGGEFDGTLTGVARHGFYVTLDPFFVEGLVHVSTLPGYAVFDPRAYALLMRGSRERFRLGDRVRVCVDRVDLVKGWIDLSLVARHRA